jgi:hypothetical protein
LLGTVFGIVGAIGLVVIGGNDTTMVGTAIAELTPRF